MAGRKQWLNRLGGVREKLAALPPELPVDRELLEALLGVPGRTALRILGELGAQKEADGRLLLSQPAFRQALEAPDIRESVAARQAKRRGAEDLLALHHRFRHGQSLRFPLVEAGEPWEVATLPAATRLAPGRLTVEFADLPDLLWQLEVLVATLIDDREAAEARVGEGAA